MGDRSNSNIAGLLVLVAVVMGGLSFAAVPFYDWFCRVTGYGGVTSTATKASDTVLDRDVTIRFDASVDAGMPWQFKPKQREMTLKLGETGLAFYEAYNPTDHVVAGTASYNVTPYGAGQYFDKIACFCFTEQVLKPGERVDMPVSFFVDPAIVDDPEAGGTTVITLSYTFFQTELPVEEAKLSPTGIKPVN